MEDDDWDAATATKLTRRAQLLGMLSLNSSRRSLWSLRIVRITYPPLPYLIHSKLSAIATNLAAFSFPVLIIPRLFAHAKSLDTLMKRAREVIELYLEGGEEVDDLLEFVGIQQTSV